MPPPGRARDPKTIIVKTKRERGKEFWQLWDKASGETVCQATPARTTHLGPLVLAKPYELGFLS